MIVQPSSARASLLQPLEPVYLEHDVREIIDGVTVIQLDNALAGYLKTSNQIDTRMANGISVSMINLLLNKLYSLNLAIRPLNENANRP